MKCIYLINFSIVILIFLTRTSTFLSPPLIFFTTQMLVTRQPEILLSGTADENIVLIAHYVPCPTAGQRWNRHQWRPELLQKDRHLCGQFCRCQRQIGGSSECWPKISEVGYRTKFTVKLSRSFSHLSITGWNKLNNILSVRI